MSIKQFESKRSFNTKKLNFYASHVKYWSTGIFFVFMESLSLMGMKENFFRKWASKEKLTTPYFMRRIAHSFQLSILIYKQL